MPLPKTQGDVWRVLKYILVKCRHGCGEKGTMCNVQCLEILYDPIIPPLCIYQGK